MLIVVGTPSWFCSWAPEIEESFESSSFETTGRAPRSVIWMSSFDNPGTFNFTSVPLLVSFVCTCLPLVAGEESIARFFFIIIVGDEGDEEGKTESTASKNMSSNSDARTESNTWNGRKEVVNIILFSELVLLPLLVLVFESVCVIRYVCVLCFVCECNEEKRVSFVSKNRCPEEILFFQKMKTLNKKIALIFICSTHPNSLLKAVVGCCAER